jgi:NADPH:quinone reductase-like Zn-dependent oxidoreductase
VILNLYKPGLTFLLGVNEGRSDSPLLTENQWDSTLVATGFSGLDVCLPDYSVEDDWMISVIVSTAVETKQPQYDQVTLVAENGSEESVGETLSCLKDLITLTPNQTMSIDNFDAAGKVCVFLAELWEPVLNSGQCSYFDKVKKLLTTAAGVLWVTRGATMDSPSPEYSLITGLARTVRSDNQGIRLVTLDLDGTHQMSPQATALLIADIYKSSFDLNTSSVGEDVEYAERRGRVHIPRLTKDIEMNEYISAATIKKTPKLENFAQVDRPLHLEVGTPGLLDSLRWVDDEAALHLEPDEVRIELKAAGVNFRDIMISLGQLEGTSRMGGECSGVVTAVGDDALTRFHIGDRVCGWGGAAYASQPRLKALFTQRVPDDMSFETAASIPIVYTTVYYSLVHLANLKRDETVLIHSAAGGVGQAAIMLAQYLGADIFVTVGSLEKKSLIMRKFGIPEDRIFSSRSTTFEQGIKRLTSGKGVDVILNSLAGEALRASCNCIATFGRFIEIGKRDILTNGRLDLNFFDRNVTYASVDLTKVIDFSGKLAGTLMDDVFKLIRRGVVRPVTPVTVFPISDIETAFRRIQAGKHMGKIVLSIGSEEQVKVSYSEFLSRHSLTPVSRFFLDQLSLQNL